MHTENLSKLDIWLLAIRPKTLPAAGAGVITGTALAFHDGHFAPLPALAALIGAILLQIGSNLANDVFDYLRGAESKERLGPLRVTQAGLLTPKEVQTGMWITFALATVAVAVTYAMIGVVVGPLVGRLGGLYLMFLLPFLVLRAVADGSDQGVPRAAQGAIDAQGAIRHRAVLARLLRRPWEIEARAISS